MTAALSKAKLKPAHFIRPTATVFEAIKRLTEARVGALLVATDNDKIEAVLTERDILRGLARHGPDFMRTHVADFVLHAPITGRIDMSVEEAARLMERNRIRHLPILERGRVVGILGAVEVFKHLNPGVPVDLKD